MAELNPLNYQTVMRAMSVMAAPAAARERIVKIAICQLQPFSSLPYDIRLIIISPEFIL
jgi:hypothetical protein